MLSNYGVNDGFLEEIVSLDKARYVLVPVPMDITTTYLKGTKFGPKSVIDASRSLENYNCELDYEVRDKIFTENELELPPDTGSCVKIIKDLVRDINALVGKIPILLGGEHTITYAASLAFPEDVIFVIFDAHADFKKDVMGIEVNHASNSRLIKKRNDVALIGVRSLSTEDKKDLENEKVTNIYAREARDDKSLEKIKEKVRGKKVYISIDMDVFDPAFAPGVGTPQPNGLDYGTLMKYLESVIDSSELVGFDVTETRPLRDNNITEVLAAKLVIDMVSMNEKKTLK